MPLTREKPWYLSKSVWGGIVALVAVTLSVFGYGIGADDQAILVDYAVSIGGAVGGLLAIYGRIVASKKVGK